MLGILVFCVVLVSVVGLLWVWFLLVGLGGLLGKEVRHSVGG